MVGDRLPIGRIESTIASIEETVMIGAFFVIVGYLLILGTLFLELTQFHPLLEEFFSTHTQWSLAGGGPDRAGQATVNARLSEIHRFPSTLLWRKLGEIGHILVGIFISLAAITRVLGLMPHRLSHAIEPTQGRISALVHTAPGLVLDERTRRRAGCRRSAIESTAASRTSLPNRSDP